MKRKNIISLKGEKFDKDVFLKNVSNVNASFVLNEKYLNKNYPNHDDLNELFDENFLRNHRKMILNHEENKKSMLRSSQNINKTNKIIERSSSKIFNKTNKILENSLSNIPEERNNISSIKKNPIRIQHSRNNSSMLGTNKNSIIERFINHNNI